MSQFLFQLDGVLRQRKHAEEQKQRELAVVRAEMTALEAELGALDQTVQSATDDLRTNHLTGRLDLNFLAAHRRFTLGMQRKALGLAQQMAGVRRRLDEAHRALAEAAKQRKILEKLRERRESAWRADLTRRESADLDEIGTRIGYANTAEAANALATTDWRELEEQGFDLSPGVERGEDE